METTRAVADLWPVFLGFIFLVAWLVRGEVKGNQNAKDIERVEKNNAQEIEHVEKKVDVLSEKHDSLDSKVVGKLSEVRESLARIEGALGLSRGQGF